jgi:hypothetical protein
MPVARSEFFLSDQVAALFTGVRAGAGYSAATLQ